MIVLGRGSPDKLRDGRETVCVAGYSEKLGFIRIFPTKITSPLKRWNIIQVEVDRDKRDTRNESWKIIGSKNEWNNLDEKIKVIGHVKPKDRKNIVVNKINNCVNTINNAKDSLGIVKPIISQVYFGKREYYNPYIQQSLMRSIKGEAPVKTKENYPEVPRIGYRCLNCIAKKGHDQQVIDWGFYEWLRKNPDKKEQVWENAKLVNNEKSDIYFLVGNQMVHRNSFMVISVLSMPKKNSS